MRVLPKMSLRKRNFWIGLADGVVCLATVFTVFLAYYTFYMNEALTYIDKIKVFKYVVGPTREVNSLESNAIGTTIIVTLIAVLTVMKLEKRHEDFIDELNKECSMEDDKRRAE